MIGFCDIYWFKNDQSAKIYGLALLLSRIKNLDIEIENRCQFVDIKI